MLGHKVAYFETKWLSMNQSEKRLFKRLDVGLEVELFLKGKQLKTKTSNISCGGLFLKVNPEELKGNKDLSLKIHLPNRQRPVELNATVLRQEAEENPGIALLFDGLYNDNILAIEQFIKSKVH